LEIKLKIVYLLVNFSVLVKKIIRNYEKKNGIVS
jgi:hypothetical protein